jgi:DNA polymerase III sliding clamp (beta) subunit (PCNA family)
MTDLLALSEREDDLVPEIMPVDARLSFSAQSHSLVAMLTSAVDITPSKEIIPHTTYVLLEAYDERNEIEISATDGERAITVVAPAIVRMSGTALVPGKRMLDILKLADDTVRVDIVGMTATIRSGRAVWSVATADVNASLPVFPSTDVQWWDVPRLELLHALELGLPAVSRTTARQSLMQAEISKSSILSCDGVRAHKVSIPGLAREFKSTLPLRFIESAIKELRSSPHETAYLWSDHNTVALALGKNRLYAQRLNFDFPAVNHLMLGPALPNEEKLSMRREELMGAIRRVRVNADPEYSAIYLSIRQVKGEWNLILSARDKNGNASQEMIPANYEGPAKSRDIALNHRYLLEFLSCTSGEEIELRLGESTKTKQAPVYYESDQFVGSLMVMAPNLVRN